jgi:ferric-dicitrate binding protein FerR (iron transport regulator)
MDNQKIESLLDRYQKGEASLEEKNLVEKWLEERDNQDSEWKSLNDNAKEQWLGSAFNKIQDTLDLDQPKVVHLPQRSSIWKRIAAVAAVAALIFTIYRQAPSFFNQDRLTTLSVPANQRKLITLPDGSTVWLNAASKLKYSEDFNDKVREVYLSGEAYFDVQHNPEKRFIIHTGKIVTTVLGTAFNIKEDENKHTITVTVTRGKVKVANGNKQLGIITPNQQISFNLKTSEAVQNQVNASESIAWQEADLHFEDITFAEAAVKLQQQFNVKINFSNEKLKECRFTGSALDGAKLENILKVICEFNGAIYRHQTDGSILIEGKGCN